ncbi:MAG: porin [Bacteroidales bacterium]|jgi:phosphate-selective porin
MKNQTTLRAIITITFLLVFISFRVSYAQSANDVLNLLIANKSITQQQADSIRAEAALKQQEADANRKSFPLNASRLFQLSGYTQVRYQQLEESGKTSGFDIRRARLDLKGTVTPFFGYRLQADFAGSPKLLDAYSEIRIADYFTITAGQFKIPFSYENLAADNQLEVIDRSQVVEALVARTKDVLGNTNGRDIGIQAGGTFLKINGTPLVEYYVAVLNGSGINVADTANSNKDLAARLVFTPLKGLYFGGSYYDGWDKVTKPDVAGKSQARDRLGFEAGYVLPRFSVRGEYISGKDGKTDRSGWYLMACYYVLPQKLQFIVRYDTYDPNTSKPNNITTNYTIGGNFSFNKWSRLQIDYTFRAEQGPSVKNDYLAIQYQIGF